MHAVRNIRLCTKDCLCLYVCPTGATDTEDGQIDASKCLNGCRACVDACPSGAISLIPEIFPPQQQKSEAVKSALKTLTVSKIEQEIIATHIVDNSEDVTTRQLAKAISMSNRLMVEDLLRESGYMLPQSKNVLVLLQSFLETEQSKGFPKDAVEELISSISESNITED